MEYTFSADCTTTADSHRRGAFLILRLSNLQLIRAAIIEKPRSFYPLLESMRYLNIGTMELLHLATLSRLKTSRFYNRTMQYIAVIFKQKLPY